MDNNEHKREKSPSQKNNPPKRKKVTKKMLRQRQLCGLAVIALIILIIFVAIAKGCSNNKPGDDDSSDSQVTTTATTSAATTTVTTTVTTTTTNPLAANVQLDKRELFVTVGDESQSIYARILSYPDENTGEINEVWKSMDESIATVNSWGAVTGVSEGETFIILSFDNHPELEFEIKVHVASGSVQTSVEAYPEVTTIDGETDMTAPDMPTTPVYGYSEDSGNENASW